jgi:hypothetical protein
MVFNATFNNVLAISWRSVLFVEETEVPEDDQRPVVSHWQTLSHNVVFGLAKLVLIGTDCIGSYKMQLPYDYNHDAHRPPSKQ